MKFTLLQFSPLLKPKPNKNRARAPHIVTDAHLVEQSREAFIDGNYSLSEWLVNAAIAINPNNDQALELKADICYLHNHNREAADYYHEVLNLRSERKYRKNG